MLETESKVRGINFEAATLPSLAFQQFASTATLLIFFSLCFASSTATFPAWKYYPFVIQRRGHFKCQYSILELALAAITLAWRRVASQK